MKKSGDPPITIEILSTIVFFLSNPTGFNCVNLTGYHIQESPLKDSSSSKGTFLLN